MKTMSMRLALTAAISLAGLGMYAFSADVAAQRHGGGHARSGGGGHQAGARSSARTSVNRPQGNRSASQANRGTANRANVNRSNTNRSNVNRANVNNTNVNRTNINNNTNINRNVNVDVHNDYHDHDHWNDWDDHPFATAAAVTAGVAITSAVIGSIVYSVPPSCTTVVVNGATYSQCGSTWYQPQYMGSSVQYVVVNAPR